MPANFSSSRPWDCDLGDKDLQEMNLFNELALDILVCWLGKFMKFHVFLRLFLVILGGHVHR